jgi:prepilin-type N-terminal cleavage/methylation domain-containing protein
MEILLKKKDGLTLIELLVALVLSSILIAALFRTFVGQQKTYTIQEQVVDVQQNVRVATSKMMSEIRLAGFGNVQMILPVTFNGGLVTFSNIVNRNIPSDGWITLVTAVNSISQTAILDAPSSPFSFIVDKVKDDNGNYLFDSANRKYLSVDGVESHTITKVDEVKKTLTLKEKLIYKHPKGTRVYPVRAISYRIGRDTNLGGGEQDLAENIENIQYRYLDADGNETADPFRIRMVRVTVTARTNAKDPDYKAGDGYRRREITSNLYIRNMK